MRRWVWVLFIATAVQSAGCCHLCDRCCSSRGSARESRIPPPDLNEGPPPAVLPGPAPGTPATNPKPTGAYGGS